MKMHIKDMQNDEVFTSRLSFFLNTILFPLKMIVPQPVIAKIPGLWTNEEIRMRLVLHYVRGRLLDIGCGKNQLVKMYRSMGGDGMGIDVFPWNGVDLVVKDSSETDFPDQSFDTITFVACLNHIPNREDVLKEALRLLTPKGRIILTNLSPFVSRIWHAWAFWDKDQHERGMQKGEVWGFTPQELAGLLDRNGFKILYGRRFSWKFNQIYVCCRKDWNATE
jgi:SAM-dependent methyltransferase